MESRRQLSSLDLRRLRQAGHRQPVIRKVLRDWQSLLSGDEDLEWLEQALPLCDDL